MKPVRTWRIAGGLAMALAVALCVGCARARVKNAQTERITPLPRPARVIVFDFATGESDVQVLSSPGRSVARAVRLSQEQPDLLAEAVANTLASRLVDDVRGLGLFAERAAGAASPDTSDLVIEGDFVRIDEGSRTKRFIIGFGVGATELRTQVRVFQVTPEGWRPVQQFETVATGARLPGAGWFVAGGAVGGTVATSAMISSGIGVLRELRASIDADAGRTAEQIAVKLSVLKTAQQW